MARNTKYWRPCEAAGSSRSSAPRIPEDLATVSRALSEGGVKFVEITMTVPGALGDHPRRCRAVERQPTCSSARARSWTLQTARAAIIAGAQFIVGPVLDLETVRLCNSYGVVVMPGALTPTEIFQAWKSGADVVKVFPGNIGGPDYIKGIKEPLPQIELLPTKGVDFNTAAAYIKAGAIAVGAGTNLVNKALIAAKQYARIKENAERMVHIVRDAKEGK